MNKPEVIFLGSGPDWYLARYAEDFTLHMLEGPDASVLPGGVAERVEALISAAPVSAETMAAFPALRLIANPGAGYEMIDVETATRRGIRITNTPGVTDGCVADLAIGLLLAVGRHIVRGDRFVRRGDWPKGGYPLVPRMHGRKMGILGMGRIGRAIARRAQAFDMDVSYHNRRIVSDVPFTYHDTPEALAAAVDILVIACPGGAETRHLVDGAVLKALGANGIVVNISRGTIIDEEALIEALETGTILGAGLDVFENEPNVPARLRALDTVVLMPHRGGGTHETWADACDLVKGNLTAFFENRPLLTPIN